MLSFLVGLPLSFSPAPFHQETRSNPEVLQENTFVAKDFVVDTEVIQEVLNGRRWRDVIIICYQDSPSPAVGDVLLI